jgi:GNAT superfamily N-acetyltransferase
MQSMARDGDSAAIRYAAAADASALSHLGARTFRAAFADGNDPHRLESYIADHYSTAIQAAELQDDRLLYLVVEHEEQLVGFALLRSDQSHPDVTGNLPMRLARIYVDTPYLGAGLGSALMRRCIAECRTRGYDVLWLGVWEVNAKAIAFYERWGFARVGVEEFDVGGDRQRDAILMLPILAPS